MSRVRLSRVRLERKFAPPERDAFTGAEVIGRCPSETPTPRAEPSPEPRIPRPETRDPRVHPPMPLLSAARPPDAHPAPRTHQQEGRPAALHADVRRHRKRRRRQAGARRDRVAQRQDHRRREELRARYRGQGEVQDRQVAGDRHSQRRRRHAHAHVRRAHRLRVRSAWSKRSSSPAPASSISSPKRWRRWPAVDKPTHIQVFTTPT